MRDYAKLSPTFWTGETGKALRRRGSEAVIVALYLVSSPHSNMLGLFYQPIPYMAHETGLGQQGAAKGLQACVELGFCSYDADADMVWVHEMAAWQIAGELKPADLRCKGIQKDYDGLPNCRFLGAFFDRYAPAFHMTKRRADSGQSEVVQASLLDDPSPPPTKPLRSQEQEQEQEQDPSGSEAKASGAVAPPAKPLTVKDRVWALGEAVLGGGKGERSKLGRLVSTHGEPVVLDALQAALREEPGDPYPWLVKACEAKAQPTRTNGHHNLQTTLDLANRPPRQAWATEAGFETIFEAENAGCYERNAHRFRNGKRVDSGANQGA